MNNCDDCGRLVETTRVESQGDSQNLCANCLKWYAGVAKALDKPGQCQGAIEIGNDSFRCKLPAYHGGHCQFTNLVQVT